MKAINPIIEDIHAFRAEYAQRYGDDLKAICEADRHKQVQSGLEIVSFFQQAQPANSHLRLTNHFSGSLSASAEFKPLAFIPPNPADVADPGAMWW